MKVTDSEYAREHVLNEAQWLRRAGTLTETERRELLAGLSGRLHDLTHQLDAGAVPADLYSPLIALAVAIDSDEDAEHRWDEVLGVLDEFVGDRRGRRGDRAWSEVGGQIPGWAHFFAAMQNRGESRPKTGDR
jgi:hypothetical protein